MPSSLPGVFGQSPPQFRSPPQNPGAARLPLSVPEDAIAED